MTFNGATFSGSTVDFCGVLSGGSVFLGAALSGETVSFRGATFSGATVDLSSARGRPPSGVVPASEEPLPDGLILPSAW
ncbi:hypothetical protein GCM10010321_34150 [Streptomyces chartreusis]|nr:hypothetical protein GCM10010321_34150 [Streptomyces chartreusis]